VGELNPPLGSARKVKILLVASTLKALLVIVAKIPVVN
jgi:hypothetical protein